MVCGICNGMWCVAYGMHMMCHLAWYVVYDMWYVALHLVCGMLSDVLSLECGVWHLA